MSAVNTGPAQRDVMEYDVAVVGGGPAGLSTAIRLKQLRPELTICVLEKGSTIGAHSLSGAVMEPGPLDALLPEWRSAPLPIRVPVTRDEFRLLGSKRARRVPWIPPSLHNEGNFIISLGGLAGWLGGQAEQLGVDVFAGFAAALPLFDDDGSVAGVQIGDMGVQHDGSRGPNYTAGPEVHAKLTVIAEGCRGSLAKVLINRYKLDSACDPQSYALGMKELWQLPPGRVQPGLVQHTVGWPLDSRTYGGSFVYHLNDNRAYVGFVAGLDYIDPRFSPFESFQQFKHHPSMHAFLQGGEILSAGARSICAGGWQSMPKLEMPGAMLVGDAAGTLNMPKIKGIHQAIRCGMAAAEYFAANDTSIGFDAEWRRSEAVAELHEARNVKPGFKRGLWLGMLNAALESVLGGRTPWTLRNTASYAATKQLSEYESPNRHWKNRDLPPRDRLSSVFFAVTAHDEVQPVHLHVRDKNICATTCATEFGNPCTRFCPAAVYEMVDDEAGGKKLHINAANCVHCKACDIKDPYQIIDWVTPEGGSGPNYQLL
ncbi:MAG TPA: electron transfer flavoprotein-ubiquinone oxidoreductase [Steroidobacteraceae bacterium]|jgi:electron-transferring-flavoprotein dehydrogenase|nr:electron transfer flavoprotein-ubiquinone oxidoreductase [Steroidobacteraceae bacterium]